MRYVRTFILPAVAAMCLHTGCSSSAPERRPDALPHVPSRASGESRQLMRPVATPVDSSETDSGAIAVAVRPFAPLPFNGVMLPLVSPDGRFIATQTGAPPTWPTILARPGAVQPRDAGLQVFAISDDSLDPVRFDFADSDPLLLGRSCNRTGFLVESPRPGGERWIGFIEWVTGRLTWLTRDASVSAHATLLTLDGTDIAFTQRRFEDNRTSLVIQQGGRTHTMPSPQSSWYTPFMSDDGATLCAFEVRGNGEMHVVAIDLTATPPVTIARAIVARTDDPLMPWQATAAIQTPPPALPAIRTDNNRRGRGLFHHPARGRMCVFDTPSGTLIPLEPHSIAGAWNPAPASEGQVRGVFLTEPEGLSHQAMLWSSAEPVAPDATRAVRILADAFVPRLIDPVERTFLLIGPDPAQPTRQLQLTLMQAAPNDGWFRVSR